MTRTTARLTSLTVALLAGALVLAGCADDDNDAAGHGSMMNDTGSSASSSAEQAEFNDADVTFAQGMIPHHRQAIVMAELAEGRAADPRVLDLAARIQAAQDPEIETMSGWLQDWDADGGHMDGMDDGMGAMDHGEGGMMSEGDMHALMSATGPQFDRLFLEQMIVHHQGAVEMAAEHSANGRNAEALALAQSIRDNQNAEIAEMQQLLTELGG
ncbi:Uncharacterized conserved protein, DUF305 family [Blastococcus sp. DSM 46786]|uniref:DUF305 domain-containing protein n=1 Tax=Geodermatophilaceae TaxID=85030 RepID=UPI0008B96FCA|nr:DUF305 domain-containing protein [Blastococcus sp. DSM 46786]SEL26599.1 Uncharacterized conserved protein, DUF305 family [Blastococcus sp. DSM 46786]